MGGQVILPADVRDAIADTYSSLHSINNTLRGLLDAIARSALIPAPMRTIAAAGVQTCNNVSDALTAATDTILDHVGGVR